MARQISEQIVKAFVNRQPAQIGNSSTDGRVLYLFGNAIAKWVGTQDLQICPVYPQTTRGGKRVVKMSNTTRERLHALLDQVGSSYRLYTKKGAARLWNYRDQSYKEWTILPGEWFEVVGVNHGKPVYSDPAIVLITS